MAASARRPWYQWHRSTWAVIAVTLLLLILIAVPGGNVESSFGITVVVLAHHEHGWPFVWLDRCDWPTGAFRFDPGLCAGLGELRRASDGDAFWMTLDDWPKFSPLAPELEGACPGFARTLAITAAIAFLWEWWRRRHFQYRLRSLFGVRSPSLARAGIVASRGRAVCTGTGRDHGIGSTTNSM